MLLGPPVASRLTPADKDATETDLSSSVTLTPTSSVSFSLSGLSIVAKNAVDSIFCVPPPFHSVPPKVLGRILISWNIRSFSKVEYPIKTSKFSNDPLYLISWEEISFFSSWGAWKIKAGVPSISPMLSCSYELSPWI